MSVVDANEVAQLLSEGKYDLSKFLEYLKSLSVAGELPDRAILLGILMQSLARFPTSDFTACMCLVPSYVQDSQAVEKEVSCIYELENLLSCGQFANFWAQWAEVKENLPESFHFETRLRTSILETVGCTIESISAEKLASFLAVPVEQLQRTIDNAKQQGGGDFEIVSLDNKTVQFSRNQFNAPESQENQDAVHFGDITAIVMQR